MNKRARKITFPNVGIEQGSRVWRNSETGVEIIKGKNFATVGLYYVCVPTRPTAHDGNAGRRIVAHRNTLAGARDVAASRVHAWRAVIAKAYAEAADEYAYTNGLGYAGEGRMIRQAAGLEQIKKWCERHDIALSFGSAPAILAAREVDHDEALKMNAQIKR